MQRPRQTLNGNWHKVIPLLYLKSVHVPPKLLHLFKSTFARFFHLKCKESLPCVLYYISITYYWTQSCHIATTWFPLCWIILYHSKVDFWRYLVARPSPIFRQTLALFIMSVATSLVCEARTIDIASIYFIRIIWMSIVTGRVRVIKIVINCNLITFSLVIACNCN